MKILYDHLGFMHKYGGVPKYFVKILEMYDSDVYELSVLLSNNYYLNEAGLKKTFPFFPNMGFKGKFAIMNYINKMYSLANIWKGNYDIYHQTLYDTYALSSLPRSKIFVTTMHDLNFVKIPQFYQNRSQILSFLLRSDLLKYQKESAKKADHIIAISETTKHDLINEWDIDENKITVIYHGIAEPISDLPLSKLHSRPYVLFVGARVAYKNFNNAIRAFAIMAQKYDNIDFICTGKSFDESELNLFTELKIQNRVFCISASENQMACLYRDALCFIYPSFYEGFGMPILEAMSYKCPVILSKASCFPEIACDAGLYFDPYSIDDILLNLEKVLTDSECVLSLKEKGSKRVLDFSWKKTAKMHLDVYKSLL
jgi:glycosyltransferase involved in cell wall biosynthesis